MSLSSFADYLISQQVSHSTYKNYLSDIRYFFKWQDDLKINDPLTPSSVTSYRDHLSLLPITTANRKLSALRKYCNFSNVHVSVSNLSPLPPKDPQKNILHQFAKDLKNEGASPTTIKNYLSDTKKFLEQEAPPETYITSLQKTPSSTTRRRLSSLRKFLSLYAEIPAPTPDMQLPAPKHRFLLLLVFAISFSLAFLTTQIILQTSTKPTLISPIP